MNNMPKPYLPAAPLDECIRITAIETVIPDEWMPGLLLVRIHTDAGVLGHGETYYAPHAVAALIHDWMASRLLNSDALAIENHWRFFYERFANFGGMGAELRAISAIDLALWDILGQVCKQPIYRLLGGPVRDKVRVYNSCGNPRYGRTPSGGGALWPGYGGLGEAGTLSDSYNLFHAPDELAAELLEEGWSGVKTWPFDFAAHAHGGAQISLEDLEKAVAPLRKIRERVGDKIEIMVDGHGFFLLPAALRIADALREIKPLWLEDVLKTDCLETLADFRKQSRMPISVSEMILRRSEFARVLHLQAADWIQIDPTWCGGISETIRLAHMAETFNLPVSTHDCTGPLTTLAGLHINASVASCAWQETVRAHVRTFYNDLIEPNIEIKNGYAELPRGAGLGARLNPDLFSPEYSTYRISRAAK